MSGKSRPTPPRHAGTWSRRDLLARASNGFGLLALTGLFAGESRGEQAAPKPHFPPKAKNVIFCYMSGGVSQVDSFDPKPRLAKEAGKPMPVPIDRTMFNQNGNISRALGNSATTVRAASRSASCSLTSARWPTSCASSDR
jgi:hypothetical protein